MHPGRRSTAGRGTVPGFAVALTVVAGVAYLSFLAEPWLSPDLDHLHGYASELYAADQPFHLVYRAGDLVTGVLTVVVATTALLTSRRRPWAPVCWTLLLLFGVCVVGDAIFTLDCAPSQDTGCALRERAGLLSFSHEFHSVTSSAVIVCAVATLLALSVAGRGHGPWTRPARWGRVLAAAEAAATLLTLAFMILGVWLGLAQRVQILILSLGLFVIAWALHGDRRAAAEDLRPTPRNDLTMLLRPRE